jgi:outer membrane lipoprotein-sorting protein
MCEFNICKEIMMKLLKQTCVLLVFFCAGLSGQAADLSSLPADELLKRVDEYRNFKNTAFSFDLELVSEEKNKTPKKFGMHAKILNSHTSLVMYREPVREQGKALLMNGRHLWFFSKMAKKPIRITPQQRLLGEASNGDVASTDFSGDYQPQLVQGTKAETNQLILQLDAKTDSLAAYHKILLWVDAGTAQPQKAEFYTQSGKHLKTAYYTRFEALPNLDNKLQLVELEIHNALTEGNITRMRYSHFQTEDLQENQFRPEQISRLMAQR